jgi:hypothetical protein
VIAGTATAVSNRVSRRQANRWGAQEQQQYEHEYYEQQQGAPPPAAAPAGASQEDKLEQLKTLGELKASGVLTDAEFEVQKEKILQS